MAKGQKRAKNVQPNPNPPSIAPAVSPTISYSDSSGAEDVSRISDMHGEDSYGPSASGAGSPSQRATAADLDMQVDTEDSVTCQWEDCGQVFVHLPTLIQHIHQEHIGVHKSNYTCEWASCLRRGLPQTSRFALISHIRSHTGEKPFVCNLPECDKSFTRSDALAKHMRLQHDISPPAPGRGGSRKRKRGGEDQNTQGTSTPVASVVVSPPSIPNASGFNMFKVEPRTPSEAVDASGNEMTQEYFKSRSKTGTNGRQRRQPRPSQLHSQHTPSADGGEDEEGYSSSSSDTLPAHLQEHFDEATGLVLGRTPAKVVYLCMKAKQQFALDQNTKLLEQLRDAKNDLKKEKDEKEGALDLLLRRMLGPDAEILMPLAVPPEMSAAPTETSTAPAATATAPPTTTTAPAAAMTAPAEMSASSSKDVYDSTRAYPDDVDVEKPKPGPRRTVNKVVLKPTYRKPTVTVPAEMSASNLKDVDDSIYAYPDDVDVEKPKLGPRRTVNKVALKPTYRKTTATAPAEMSASSSKDVDDSIYANPDDVDDDPETSASRPKLEYLGGPLFDYPSDGSDEERVKNRRRIVNKVVLKPTYTTHKTPPMTSTEREKIEREIMAAREKVIQEMGLTPAARDKALREMGLALAAGGTTSATTSTAPATMTNTPAEMSASGSKDVDDSIYVSPDDVDHEKPKPGPRRTVNKIVWKPNRR